jgi:hypothetical protein
LLLSRFAQFPKPAIYSFLAGSYARISDASIFCECILASQRPDTNAFRIAFEKQVVPGLNSKKASYFAGNGDLSFAREFGLFLHLDILCSLL